MWVLLLAGCDPSSGRDPPRPTQEACPARSVEERTRALQSSLARGEIDRCAVSDAAEADVEIRDALVETDERRRTSHRGFDSLSARLAQLAARTLETAGALRCAGDCCDVQRSGMSTGRLYLRRACFAYAGRLSLLALTEVR